MGSLYFIPFLSKWHTIKDVNNKYSACYVTSNNIKSTQVFMRDVQTLNKAKLNYPVEAEKHILITPPNSHRTDVVRQWYKIFKAIRTTMSLE